MSFDALVKRFPRTYVGNQLPNLEQIRTGILGLDFVLAGGMPVGRLVEIMGTNNTGKSTTALTVAKAFIARGQQVVYVDAERHVKEEDLARLSIDSSQIIFNRPDNAEGAIEFMRAAAEAGIGLIVVDSIPALSPQGLIDRLEADAGASEMALRARFWSLNQSTLYTITETYNCSILAINQIRTSLSPYAGGGPITPGGVTIPFVATNRVWLRSNGKPSDEVKTVEALENSFRTTFNGVKSKTGPSYLTGCADYTAYGIDPVSGLISKAKEEKVISAAGSSYRLDESVAEQLGHPVSLAKGYRGCYEKLLEDKALYDKLYDLIVSRARTKRPEPPDMDSETLEELIKAQQDAESSSTGDA